MDIYNHSNSPKSVTLKNTKKKRKPLLCLSFRSSSFMSVRGFEPRTTWLKVKCSTDWATRPYALDRNRTSDTRIFSPLLYQLSYLGIDYKSLSCGSRIWTCDLRVMSPTSFQTAPSRDIKLISQKRKADDRTRTDNLLITNQLLCQLSHIGL